MDDGWWSYVGGPVWLKFKLLLDTGVIQKVLPVLSTETLLHIWLSTKYYGFRPSSTAVDTEDTRGLMMSR